jgi:hypothetical protein
MTLSNISALCKRSGEMWSWCFWSSVNIPERTKVRALSTFASVLCNFGCLLLGSFCTFTCPSLNRQCHSKTPDFFIAYSP